ncbi:MAG TPA: hypothetical protein VKG23_07025 [Thermoanaerobaculia bacterium]|nr:hypothetical protein [Thermoanaerobaculia bacterium]
MAIKPAVRLTRLGLPEKSAKIIFAVTEEEKREIQEMARSQRITVTEYLIGMHRLRVRQLRPDERQQLIRDVKRGA